MTEKKDPPKVTDQTSKAPKGKLRENIEAIVIAIVLALFIRAFVVQAFKIPTGSMKDTLLVGDYILVNKFIYGVKIPFTEKTIIPIKDPRHGEIVVFKFPQDTSKDYIKRVVGVGGDTVEIRDKKVYVNGKVQKDDFAKFAEMGILPPGASPRDNFPPRKIPEGKLFVMGDNRDHSNDSRFWGLVDVSAVRGRAFMIYWSKIKGKAFAIRWGRLGHMIH